MDTTVAVDFGHESAFLDAVNADIPKAAGLGRRRMLALVALSAFSAVGFVYALIKTLAESKAGWAAEATEKLVRRREELSSFGVAITVAFIAVVAIGAAVVALRRTTEE
ncbi:MAG: hypothetical protein ACRDKB_05690 [Actinomycetota bacterium]